MDLKKILFLILTSCFTTQVSAQSALVHIQGEKGSREAYFANFAIVWDVTPVDKMFGAIKIQQLDTTIVYEHPNKPEFTMLQLQFECAASNPLDEKNTPQRPDFNAPVNVRVGENSWMLRREDLKSSVIPAGDWRTSDSPVLLKLHKIACYEDELRSAIIKTAKAKSDLNVFKKEINKIGLPGDLQLVKQNLSSEFLDFAWSVLWVGEKRPDPSGKWSSRPTKKQLAEYKAKMDEIQKQYDLMASGMKAELEANIKQMDAKSKMAADIRGGRKLSRNESNMLILWEGKTEQDVAATMGAPIVTDAGDLHFMSYGKEFDNRVVVGNMQGAAWEEGLYENCNVQFILHPDNNNILRVVDVRIWTNTNQLGQVIFACDGLLEAPH
jgi:hypothetical protein